MVAAAAQSHPNGDAQDHREKRDRGVEAASGDEGEHAVLTEAQTVDQGPVSAASHELERRGEQGGDGEHGPPRAGEQSREHAEAEAGGDGPQRLGRGYGPAGCP